jgi:hypothetical protein
MTEAQIKEEISRCLRAAPPRWSEIQEQLSPPCQWLISAARGKRGIPDITADFKKKFPEDYASAGREILVDAIDVMRSQIYGHKDWKAAQDENLLDAFPAAAVIVIKPEFEPPDWKQRWIAAGGREHGGRYLALKSDPVWSRFCEFGLPHEPFDWKASLSREDVDRAEAQSAGLLKRPAAKSSGAGCALLITMFALAAAATTWALTR